MRNQIISAIKNVTGNKAVHLETPDLIEHGDYSTNIALQQKGGNPRDKAEEIVGKLKEDKELMKLVEKIEVAGPGFINFYLNKAVLFGSLEDILNQDDYGSGDVGKDRTVLIEYSSPNIAKRFSIGHMRSTIIGQSLYNLYSFLGYKTVSENHLGDWGTQFGIVIAQVKRKNLKVDDLTVEKLEQLYVEFNRQMEDKPELRDLAKEWFKKLEEGDTEARDIWEKVKGISIAEFEKIYQRLGVKMDNNHGESFYEDKMNAVINDFRDRGLTKKSKGAEIVELPGLSPAMLLKSDGTTTYFTRDLAAIKYRMDTWHPEKIIYEVGSQQILHFKQVFKAAKLVGYVDDEAWLVHVAHGWYLNEKGKKFSTRKGETVKLEDILDEAVKRARKILDEGKVDLSDKEKDTIADQVGIGAVKYFDLSHQPMSNIVFNWENMFNMEGNSATYLQYTYARAQSVLRKSTVKGTSLHGDYSNDINNEETMLLRSFIHFPEVVQEAAENYSPNLICNYLFDLAQKFNGFYNAHRILDNEDGREKPARNAAHNVAVGEQESKSEFRLALTEATGTIIKNGLDLLGIKAPEKM